MRLSCYLIGGDTLLAQCAEILLAEGHEIRGIVTDAERIAHWAADHGIPAIPAGDDYASVLQGAEYDYLFAITHLKLIPDNAAQSPRKLAINFHDGPLPRYAGLNTPLWAIMNGETEYGITWHVMSSRIDQGDILLRHPVTIAPDDTGLSLNTKCFAAALESFPTLVAQLASGNLKRETQPAEGRRHYLAARKPPGAGVLDWGQPAIALERTVRALNVGRYPNPLATPKILLGREAFIVDHATARPSTEGKSPGQITELNADSLAMQTADGELVITALLQLDGTPIRIETAAARAQLAPGAQLPAPSAPELAAIERLAATTAKREPALVELLRRIEPIALPYRLSTTTAAAGRAAATVPVPVPKKFRDSLKSGNAAASLQAAFAIFLARVLDRPDLHVAVAADAASAEAGSLRCLLSAHSYVAVRGEADEPLRLEALAATIAKAASSPTWLRDLVARQPALRDNPELAADRAPAVLIAGQSTTAASFDHPPSLIFHANDDGTAAIDYAAGEYSEESIARLIGHFGAVLEQLATTDVIDIESLNLLSTAESQLVLEAWNQTAVDYDPNLTIHAAFEQQAKRTPSATAIVSGQDSISYADLDRRATALAARLRQLGIGPDVLVGVHISRSIELMVATLAVLKAGGAYVPLDPAFPADRLEFMIADSKMPLIVTQSRLRGKLPPSAAQVINIEGVDSLPAASGPANPVAGNNLAYVIYTSGSTGKPKGVAIEHRNVTNFFLAMDQKLPRARDRQDTWLAVTSLSFDISVLELFWTLTRGFRVAIYSQSHSTEKAVEKAAEPAVRRALGLGLFMWGNDDAPGPAKYRLLMEGAKFFDQNGFVAVWTPERHFHAFGGPYPNPAVTGAAVAAVTNHVKIRAGSCVVPLHHPIRIAEEWAVVDNLSNGRAEIAAASGWNPDDFVLKPENHAKNKEILFTALEQVRQLWRGQKLKFPGPLGKDVEVQSLPRPVQPELPCWVTTAGNPETWRDAGRRGFNVLTHLLGQTVAEVGEKIALYRRARAEAGFDPAAGRVALMLHTFVGEDDDSVRELVREPMKSYLASSMRLAMNFAWSFPAFKRPGGQETKPEDVDIKSLTAEEVDTILGFAFERYFSTSGLFGSIDTCLKMLKACSAIGVDEIACLLDFGIETETVMQSLPRLKQLNDLAQASLAPPTATATAPAPADLPARRRDVSFPGLVRELEVTHLQCTPSMARMFATDSDARAALAGIPHLLLGGEALPAVLVSELLAMRRGTLTNMYGPTETTIWSMTHPVTAAETSVPIGRPIANTRIYILDERRRPVPVGVAGQLYIGGDGVARGYLNRPELTAERFLADPFDSRQGARMYATGDLARFRPDGTVEFLGRADFQVKVRGFRIELGEIEAVLEGQPGVAESAVVVRAEDASDVRLAAYVVWQKDAKPDAAALKAALGAKLPDYMVPNEFIDVPAMPRTANGKLDRKALIAIRKAVVRETPEALPASETEKIIAELWKQTLKLETVGVDENFFDLGGHSLLVVQLHSKLKQKIPSPISLTDLYQYPTIRSLSGYLSSGAGKALEKSVSRGAKRRALRSRSGA